MFIETRSLSTSTLVLLVAKISGTPSALILARLGAAFSQE
jgi:hypothetical protein